MLSSCSAHACVTCYVWISESMERMVIVVEKRAHISMRWDRVWAMRTATYLTSEVDVDVERCTYQGRQKCSQVSASKHPPQLPDRDTNYYTRLILSQSFPLPPSVRIKLHLQHDIYLDNCITPVDHLKHGATWTPVCWISLSMLHFSVSPKVSWSWCDWRKFSAAWQHCCLRFPKLRVSHSFPFEIFPKYVALAITSSSLDVPAGSKLGVPCQRLENVSIHWVIHPRSLYDIFSGDYG